jgi:GWxTD domain-containing protein
MNLRIGGWIRFFMVGLTLLAPIYLSAQQIEMHIEQNRFLDNEGNTVYHFNYKIPNDQLAFVQFEEGFLATVEVVISVEDEEGELTVINTFPHYIGVRDKDTALSRTYQYLDKIELTLSQAQSGLKLHLNFQDKTSGNEYTWTNVLENLDSDSLLSDLEFSHRIVKEEEIPPGFEKFRRGDYQFYVDPAHIYERSLNDTLFLYYEIQNIYPAVDENTYITEKITVFNEQYSATKSTNIRGETTFLDMIHRIPVDTLETGYYQIEVEVQDRVTNRIDSIADYFVVSERFFSTQSLFADPEKEYYLLRYFLPSSRMRSWESLNNEGKRHFVDRFWTLNDPNPLSGSNDFLETVRERIQYANQHFTHFKEGWETDMGRIYIRHGEPSEIERNITDTDTKLTRKEYQIWKYRDLNTVYLFIDIQGHGNFRLIYSRNDDMEHTASNWDRHLGEDFDMSKLE